MNGKKFDKLIAKRKNELINKKDQTNVYAEQFILDIITQLSQFTYVDKKSDSYAHCMFELGCYTFFHIDHYHYKKGYKKGRETLAKLLMPNFIEVFLEIFKIDKLKLYEIFNSRSAIYGKLIREEKDTMRILDHYFSQLMIRAEKMKNLEFIKIEDIYIIIEDFSDQAKRKLNNIDMISNFLPSVFKIFDKLNS